MGQSPSSLIEAVRSYSAPGDIPDSLKSALLELTKNGVDVNYTDDDKTPLHYAVTRGQHELVDYLLTLGADSSIVDNHGNTPLNTAAFLGDKKSLNILLNKGADLSTQNQDGMTPLHWAVFGRHNDCAELLISRGADTSIENKRGQTPLTIVSALKPKQRTKMEAFLQQCLSDTKLGRSSSVSSVGSDNGTPSLQRGLSVMSLTSKPPAIRIRRLQALCKIWGITKFIHPAFISKDVEWDKALLETLPLTNSATSPEEFRASLNHLFSYLNDPNTRCTDEKPSQPPGTPEARPQAQPYVSWSNDNIAVLTANHHEQFTDYKLMPTFTSCMKEISGPRSIGVIFDVRLKRGHSVHLSVYPFKFMFYETLRPLLDKDVQLPTYRHRFFTGFPQHRDFGSIFTSGIQISDGSILTPALSEDLDGGLKRDLPTAVPRPWIFILNKGTPDPIADLAIALQISGRAKIVYETEGISGKSEAEIISAIPEIGIASFLINAGEGVNVSIRKNERLNSNGTLGFKPDSVVISSPSDISDKTLQVAQEIIRGKPTQPVQLAVANSYLSRRVEDDYPDNPFPSKELRLLALFRLWNVIKYFFPYRSQMDSNWDSLLSEYISKMEDARNTLEYSLTVAELVAQLGDSHAHPSSPALNEFFGLHMPPLETKFVEEKSVVTYLFSSTQANLSQLCLGDVILSVDGVDVVQRRRKVGVQVEFKLKVEIAGKCFVGIDAAGSQLENSQSTFGGNKR
eukprot:TRINITY_DN7607_c0_g1_i1.p1 TRINITY_DN7607_c0_g1~~TRINITY_DN7607_c0_g1_i1.p1  ORF type:complete len:740 (+),score=210.15 TRINITY_DN7607_c0_g1_i1:1-2220(+)